MHDELNPLQITTRTLEIVPGKLFLGLVPDENTNHFAGRDFSHHLAIDPADGVEFTRPIGRIVGPAEPGRLVRFPFRRHGVAEFGGRRLSGGRGFRHRKFAEDSGSSAIVHRAIGKPETG
jgi:hypothetical protein